MQAHQQLQEGLSNSVSVGWQENPSQRGTLSIITSCVITVVACTWSIQHLNVPGRNEEFWTTFWRKIKWACITVAFPEFIMAHATYELIMAMDDLKAMEAKNLPVVWPAWSKLGQRTWWPKLYQRIWEKQLRQLPNKIFRLLHKIWQKLRRLRPQNDEESRPVGDSRPTNVPDPSPAPRAWTLTHSYFANMGGFNLQIEDTAKTESVLVTPIVASQLAQVWGPSRPPEISEEDIKDRSKSDYFAKAVAVIQIAQLFLTIVIRHTRHLKFTQLEVLTLALAICGVLTYFISWYKPQDIKTSTIIKEENLQAACAKDSGKIRKLMEEPVFDHFWRIATTGHLGEDSASKPRQRKSGISGNRIPNDNIPRGKTGLVHPILLVLTVLTACFGAIHAIAWNFDFPTKAEQLLWKISTFVSVVVPILTLTAIPLTQLHRSWGKPHDFTSDCVRILRNLALSDDKDGREPVLIQRLFRALNRLEEARNDIDGVHYQEIFTKDGADVCVLMAKHCEDPASKLKLDCNLTPRHLRALSKYLPNESYQSRRIARDAKTDVFPRKPIFPDAVNNSIVYGGGVLYIIARVIIIVVAFTCLRWMPNSVYVETWTKNIPVFD